MPGKNEELLKHIRKRYDELVQEFDAIHREGDVDMRFLANDPWDPMEKQRRKEAGRPIVAEDQLNQYTNQVVNDLMINKRDVKVDPLGFGANDATARFESELIRGIHYDCKAKDVHQVAAQNAVERSFGVWGLLTDYVDDESFDQKIIVRSFPNPKTVLWDLKCKKRDFSDMKDAFVLDAISKDEFKKKYPWATIKDFTADHMRDAEKWILANEVMIAEFWQVVEVPRVRLDVDVADEERKTPTTLIYRDELPQGVREEKGFVVLPTGQAYRIRQQRKTKKRVVTQYVTNGIEILEETAWAGSWIPLFPVVGKEMWVDFGTGSKRVWHSLVRLARDAQTRLNYVRTNEVEVIGMTPKSKWVGYEGQIEGHEDVWDGANRSPVTMLLVKPVMDATGTQVLPLPQRLDYEPPIQNLEMAAESAIRAIQSAMGMYNSSVGKNDTSARSGVVIDKLDRQSDVGTFHFTAALDRALEQEGRCIEELIPLIYDTPRDVALRDRKGKQRVARINEPAQDASGNQYHYQVGYGKHTVLIGTGPTMKDQREEMQAFLDAISQIPGVSEKILDLVVRMKNFDTEFADELEARLTPPGFEKIDGVTIPPQVEAKMRQQAQMVQELQAALQELQAEKQGKVVEGEFKVEVAKIQASMDKYLGELKAFMEGEKIEADERLSRMELLLEARIAEEEHEAEMDIKKTELKLKDKDIVLADKRIEQTKLNNEKPKAPATKK